jgi:hypothetical protein
MPVHSYLYSLPYILLYLALFIASIPILSYPNNNKLFCSPVSEYFVIFLLIFFIGFRGFIHGDALHYYDFYNTIPSLFDRTDIFKTILNVSVEPGFAIYAVFCKTISSNYFFFQAISNVIDFIILLLFFKRYIPNYTAMGILFFILFRGFQLEIMFVRNAKSMMCFLLSIKYLEKRKIAGYLGLNILGSLFHISSFIYLPLYFILKKPIAKKTFFFLIIIGNLFFLFQTRWYGNILLYMNNRLALSSRLSLLIDVYLQNQEASSAYGFTLGYFERFVTSILVYHFYDALYRKNECNLLFINMFVIYLTIFLFFSEISIILERVTVLFIVSYWILLPQIYSCFSKKNKFLFLFVIFIYGFIKISGGNNLVVAVYDNVLLGHRSYTERMQHLSKYHQWLRGI